MQLLLSMISTKNEWHYESSVQNCIWLLFGIYMSKDIIHVRRAICGFCLFFALSAELVDDPPPPPNRFAMISLISGTYNVKQLLLIHCKIKSSNGIFTVMVIILDFWSHLILYIHTLVHLFHLPFRFRIIHHLWKDRYQEKR